MLSRRHRWGLHAAAAVTLAGVAVVATGAASSAANDARPDSYGGDATAASFEFQVDKSPEAFPVTDPFHDWVPYAETSLDSSGGASAIASSVYPGQGALGAPALICLFAPQLCNAVPGGIPNYPAVASAQYPAHPDDSATLSQKPFPGQGPFEVTPHNVVAHADPNLVEATTTTESVALAPVVTAEGAVSHSKQAFEGASLVLTTESTVSGVDIGGQLHIDTIRSVATARVDGRKVSDATAQTMVSGASIAGTPVTIDTTGVHVAGNGDKGALAKQVNAAVAALAAKGITVRSLDATRQVRPGVARATTGGLLIAFNQNVSLPVDVPHLPVNPPPLQGGYFGSITLAGAGVNAFASPSVPFGGGSVPVPPVPATTGNAGTPATGGAPLPISASATTTTPTGPAPTVGAPPQRHAALLGVDLTNKRLETLALVLLAYPLLVLVARPLRAPARFPGGR